jgi:hypothetical protein
MKGGWVDLKRGAAILDISFIDDEAVRVRATRLVCLLSSVIPTVLEVSTHFAAGCSTWNITVWDTFGG